MTVIPAFDMTISMQDELVAWINEHLKKPKTQSGLAEVLGTSQSGISTMLAGKPEARRIKVDEIAKIADYLEVPPPQIGPLQRLDIPTEPVPIVGEVRAGFWAPADDDYEYGTAPFAPAEGRFALRVKGDSMDLEAADGAILICRKIVDEDVYIPDGKLVVVESKRAQESEREYTVKQVRRNGDAIELVPRSTNPKWEPISYAPTDDDGDMTIHILAVVEYVAEDKR
jgi:SOS-response transcriptional repressor LexA